MDANLAIASDPGDDLFVMVLEAFLSQGVGNDGEEWKILGGDGFLSRMPRSEAQNEQGKQALTDRALRDIRKRSVVPGEATIKLMRLAFDLVDQDGNTYPADDHRNALDDILVSAWRRARADEQRYKDQVAEWRRSGSKLRTFHGASSLEDVLALPTGMPADLDKRRALVREAIIRALKRTVPESLGQPLLGPMLDQWGRVLPDRDAREAETLMSQFTKLILQCQRGRWSDRQAASVTLTQARRAACIHIGKLLFALLISENGWTELASPGDAKSERTVKKGPTGSLIAAARCVVGRKAFDLPRHPKFTRTRQDPLEALWPDANRWAIAISPTTTAGIGVDRDAELLNQVSDVFGLGRTEASKAETEQQRKSRLDEHRIWLREAIKFAADSESRLMGISALLSGPDEKDPIHKALFIFVDALRGSKEPNFIEGIAHHPTEAGYFRVSDIAVLTAAHFCLEAIASIT